MTLTRRQFAALFGGSVAGSALVPWLLRRSQAQLPMGPVRFLAVRTPHGVDRDYWIPRNGDGSDPRGADEALSSLSFDYDNSILQPLTPWRDKVTVLDGLDTQCCKEGTRASVRNAHGHNEQGTMLTGAQPPASRDSGDFDNHPSLDFFFHAQLASPALITASVEGTGTWKCMSYDAAGRFRPPVADPRAVFRSAFPADFMPPDPGEPVVDYVPGETRILAQIDAELARLEGRLNNDERAKLTAHREAIARLVPMGPGGGMPLGACTTSGSDGPSRDGNVGNYMGVREVTRAHSQVIGQAFACGRARVATLQILNDYPNYYSEVPEVRDSGSLSRYDMASFRFHENLVHDYWNGRDAGLRAGYCMGQRWAAGHFAAVLEELDAMVDPMDPTGGSILDNTVVFWHNEFGHDGHDNQHTMHPAVVAGGGNRTLKLGRYLRLRDINTGNVNAGERVPHNKLLTSFCHAMGLTDVDFFGDRDLRERAEYRGPLAPLMV